MLQKYDSCLEIIFNFGLDGSNSLTIRAKYVKFDVELCNFDNYQIFFVCKKKL
jgi:hypothetical protein